MTQKIEWSDDLERSMMGARGVNKPILLDFFNPG